MLRTRISLAAVIALAAPTACGNAGGDQPVQSGGKTTTSATTQPAGSSEHGKPKYGTFGVDLTGIDSSVKPGADFNTFAGGHWMKEQKIPSDRSRWGMFDA